MASLLVAVAVGVASLVQTPKYEASAQVRVVQKQGDQQIYLAVSGEMIQTERLPRIRIDIPEDRERPHELILELPYVIHSRPFSRRGHPTLGIRDDPGRTVG